MLDVPATIPRAALVTGGARRLGRAIALALAEAGFAVAVHCHASSDDADATAAEIRARGQPATVLPADLYARTAASNAAADQAWLEPGFVTAAVLGFAHTVGEFGVVLMMGGNIPGKTQVLSMAIYNHVEALEYADAHWLAGGMLVFSFAVLLILNSRGWNR